MSPPFPTLFLSHGAPNMALNDTPVRKFLSGLGERYPKPDAIVAVSAHFETNGAVVVTDPNPEMIYDFRGFETDLYNMRYPAPGHYKLGEEIAGLLEKADLPVSKMAKRGFDHGTWVPFSLAWPKADIPVVQLSIDPDQGPDYHFRLGKALSSLPARNIAIVGTGNITHNLKAFFSRGEDAELDANIKDWVAEFLSWFSSEIESGNTNNVLNYRENAPFAVENHPTDEHLLPIFVAMGAAGEKYSAKKIHESYTHDFLAMDAWEFSPAA
ncbi:MAG: DODA-type extradiol aromatic ring-opening family dioxygenase [Rhizobiaceae bacterium]